MIQSDKIEDHTTESKKTLRDHLKDIKENIYGEGGFGYDPIFKVDQGHTVAELSDIQKDLISHRGRACKKMNDALKKKLTFLSR